MTTVQVFVAETTEAQRYDSGDGFTRHSVTAKGKPDIKADSDSHNQADTTIEQTGPDDAHQQ